jgi:hypothetical protein
MPVAKTISAVRKPAAASKLSPPQSEGLVSRSRLLKQLDLPCSVVTIVGPPLVGKTCLAASWMTSALASNRLFDMLRYRIDDTDQDVQRSSWLMNDVRKSQKHPPSGFPLAVNRGSVQNGGERPHPVALDLTAKGGDHGQAGMAGEAVAPLTT